MAYSLVQTGTGGIKMLDEASSGIGALVLALSWNVTRAPTNTVEVGTLPANARILRIDVQVPVVSNAVTTATASVGLVGGSATFFSAAQDVKAAIGTFSQTATANWATTGSSQRVSCTYTETGGASNAGTITVAVYYCVN